MTKRNYPREMAQRTEADRLAKNLRQRDRRAVENSLGRKLRPGEQVDHKTQLAKVSVEGLRRRLSSPSDLRVISKTANLKRQPKRGG
jgi:hypothetical protein